MSQQFNTTDVLRLEVESDPTGLVNLVQNPSGELGGWGWVTPVATSYMSADSSPSLVYHAPNPSAASYFYTENLPVSAGQYVSASWKMVALSGTYRARFEFLDQNFAALAPTAQTSYLATTGTVNYGPYQAPASAAYARLRFDHYATASGGNPNAGSLVQVKEVTVAKAATSAALATIRTNLVTNPSFETNTAGWTTNSQAIRTVSNFFVGSASLVIQSGSGVNGDASTAFAAVPAQTYTVSFYSKAGSGSAPLMRVTLSDGQFRSFTPTTTWQRYSWTFTAASATEAIEIWMQSAGAPCYVDAVLVEQGSAAGAYFDGTTAAAGGWTYAWTGAAHASTSTATSSNLQYVEPVQYLNVLGPAHEIRVVREELNVGTMAATILDSALDPSQSGLIRPGRRCRLMALSSGAWAPLFTGKVLDASVSYELKDPAVPASKRARIELTATDNAAALANQQRSEGVATIAELPYVLEGAGVPWSVNGSGNQVATAVVVATNESASALDQVAVTRDTELGYAFVSRTGVLTAFKPDPSDTGWAMPESVYSDIDVSYSTQDCINEVTVKFLRYNPTTGDTEEVPYGPYRDETSVSAWGVHSAEFTIQGSAEETAGIPAYANSILTANATPRVRINSVSFPVTSAAMIVRERALMELYDLVDVANSKVGANPTCLVKGIEHSITPDKWMVRLAFSGEGVVAAPTMTPSPGNPSGKTVGQLLRPVGEITMYGGSTAPAGWLVCNGASKLTADYPDLFAAIGYTHGGSGASFNLPNLVDYFPIGAGTKALGTQGGDAAKVIGTANLPPHSHAIDHNHAQATTSSAGNHQHGIDRSSNTGGSNANVPTGTATTATAGATGAIASNGAHTHTVDLPSFSGSSGNGPGSSTPLDVMNPWRALNFIIRAV